MGNELIRPIDPDSAHAIEESAKAVGKAIDAAMQAGKYVGQVMGDLPHDLVGIMGDWVKHKRARRWAELSAETEKILRDRGIDNREDVSPSVAIPLIGAAINEDREGLKQMWAKLFAAAMDPKREQLVRPAIIELLKNMDPLDATVLEAMSKPEVRRSSDGSGDAADRLTTHLGVDRLDAFFSLEHLFELGALTGSPSKTIVPSLSSKGQLLIRAVAD